jgi:hypothetical protein
MAAARLGGNVSRQRIVGVFARLISMGMMGVALWLGAATGVANAAATIDRLYLAQPLGANPLYVPGLPITLMPWPDVYELSDGSSWDSGAGVFVVPPLILDNVTVVGPEIFYAFQRPLDLILMQYTDLNGGVHASQGIIAPPGAVFLTARKGSTKGKIRGFAEVVSNTPTPTGNFNYYSASPGDKVLLNIDVELIGTTFTPDLFDRSFTFTSSGVIDFTRQR